jgi:hypothetical protein
MWEGRRRYAQLLAPSDEVVTLVQYDTVEATNLIERHPDWLRERKDYRRSRVRPEAGMDWEAVQKLSPGMGQIETFSGKVVKFNAVRGGFPTSPLFSEPPSYQ